MNEENKMVIHITLTDKNIIDPFYDNAYFQKTGKFFDELLGGVGK